MKSVYIVYHATHDYYEWLDVVIVGESRELIETWWNNQPESVRRHKLLEFDSKELLTNSPN